MLQEIKPIILVCYSLSVGGSELRYIVTGGGGWLLSPKSYVDVLTGPQKPDFLYTRFCQISQSSVHHFLKENLPILSKLGAFYHNLPKINPIYVIWAP